MGCPGPLPWLSWRGTRAQGREVGARWLRGRGRGLQGGLWCRVVHPGKGASYGPNGKESSGTRTGQWGEGEWPQQEALSEEAACRRQPHSVAGRVPGPRVSGILQETPLLPAWTSAAWDGLPRGSQACGSRDVPGAATLWSRRPNSSAPWELAGLPVERPLSRSGFQLARALDTAAHCPQWRRPCWLCPDTWCSHVRPTYYREPSCTAAFQTCGVQGAGQE